MRMRLWMFLAAGIVVAGCAAPQDRMRITTIRGRDRTVHIFTGHHYTVEDAAGQTLAADLTQAQFRLRFPELYRSTLEAIADIDADAMPTTERTTP